MWEFTISINFGWEIIDKSIFFKNFLCSEGEDSDVVSGESEWVDHGDEILVHNYS